MVEEEGGSWSEYTKPLEEEAEGDMWTGGEKKVTCGYKKRRGGVVQDGVVAEG